MVSMQLVALFSGQPVLTVVVAIVLGPSQFQFGFVLSSRLRLIGIVCKKFMSSYIGSFCVITSS